MTEKQKENWVTQEDVKNVFNKYQTTANYLIKEIKNRRQLTSKEFSLYQDYIILCLASGIYIEPQRVKDWITFKIKDVDKEKDNFMEGKGNKCKLIFNTYKTAKFYGQRQMECPPELYKILNTFIGYVKLHSDYLLNDSNWKPLSQVTFTQKLNKIFKGNVSVNLLRHSYLTERFNDGKMSLLELTKTAKDMGHSLTQSLEYIKLDAPKDKQDDNIKLNIEEKPEIEEKIEEPVVRKGRGRPKKIKEPSP